MVSDDSAASADIRNYMYVCENGDDGSDQGGDVDGAAVGGNDRDQGGDDLAASGRVPNCHRGGQNMSECERTRDSDLEHAPAMIGARKIGPVCARKVKDLLEQITGIPREDGCDMALRAQPLHAQVKDLLTTSGQEHALRNQRSNKSKRGRGKPR